MSCDKPETLERLRMWRNARERYAALYRENRALGVRSKYSRHFASEMVSDLRREKRRSRDDEVTK
jgi:hypothetical protein